MRDEAGPGGAAPPCAGRIGFGASRTTPTGHEIRCEHDVLDRRTSRTTPSGAVTELTYDAAGDRTSLTASGHNPAHPHRLSLQ